MPQDSPNAGSFFRAGQQQDDPTGETQSPIAMSLVDAIGSGQLDVDAVLSAGRSVVDSVVKDVQLEPHKFSSTQFNLPEPIADLVRSMAAKIPDEALAGDGREEQPHITIKYGLHTDDAEEVRKVAAGFLPVYAVLGKASVFPASETQLQRGDEQYDVVKIDVESGMLHVLNKLLSDSLEHTDTHPAYKPHVTIAYVKPGLGKGIAALMNDAEGIDMMLDSFVFSSKDRVQTEIALDTSADDHLPEDALEEEPSSVLSKFARYFAKMVKRKEGR